MAAMRRGVPLRYTSYLAVMTAGIKVSLPSNTCSSSAWNAHQGILPAACWLFLPMDIPQLTSEVVTALQAARYGSALRAFDDIRAAGMQPNVVTYCSIISGLARSRQESFVKSAHKLWRELQRSGQHLDAAAYRTGDFCSLTWPLCQCGANCHDAVQLNRARKSVYVSTLKGLRQPVQGLMHAWRMATCQLLSASLQPCGYAA